ncbi:homeodomain-only protein [Microcaecilia unicolor]|uniref:Homeodomain-only protein n=1 Tax=Microcaecilia unicolor TaxID=1415580 RepID=A0A6P7XAT2_9AMPH|nr:homeodomain-only protein [Microcaecilia unicolor]XP_030050417.1 homeodomain-only protein [Microcaecilia unicolor]
MSSRPQEAQGCCVSEEQLEILEYNFSKSRQPDEASLMLIAAEAGLSETDTRIWFKKRLAKWRESEGLPAKCGSVTD